MRLVEEIALPAQAHVPGEGTQADFAPLNQAKALAPAVTNAAEWRENKAYLYGHDLMAAGFYWEAHEVWEAVWLATPANGPERVLLQALIQRANAELKLKMGRENAARRLEEQVASLKGDLHNRLPAGEVCFMGVDVANLKMQYTA